MNIRAPVDPDFLGRPFDSSALTQSDIGNQASPFPLDPASLLGLFAHIHALGLAHLASGGNLAAQPDGPKTDQRSSVPQERSQGQPGGLLSLLAAARSPALAPLANPAPGMTDATPTDTGDAGQNADRTQQRHVSGIADQVNGGAVNSRSPLLARGTTNCENAFSYCMARLPDLRSRGKCDRLKILCDNGIDGIFGPGVAGSRRIE